MAPEISSLSRLNINVSETREINCPRDCKYHNP
jgi:hypothetical protein